MFKLISVVACICLWASEGYAGSGLFAFDGGKSLVGLEGVYVPPTVNTATDIAVDIDARLRNAGIRVFTKKERTPDTPALLLLAQGQVRRFNGEEYVGKLWQLRLLQPVSLSRDPSITLHAVTWQDIQITTRPEDKSSEEERQNIERSIDAFIDAYQKANP